MQVPQRDPLQFDQGFLKKQTNKQTQKPLFILLQ